VALNTSESSLFPIDAERRIRAAQVAAGLGLEAKLAFNDEVKQ
jgi:hypothetical protein